MAFLTEARLASFVLSERVSPKLEESVFPEPVDEELCLNREDEGVYSKIEFPQNSKILPVVEKSLAVPEEKIAESSNSLSNRDITVSESNSLSVRVGAMFLLFAYVTGVLGFVVHPVLALSIIFFMAAGVLLTRKDSEEAELCPLYPEDLDNEEIAPSQEVEIEKLLRGEFAQFEEKGMLTSDELNTMMDRNNEGAPKAFSSYVEGLEYPYAIFGVKNNPDAIVKHFAKQDVESVQKVLNPDGYISQENARDIHKAKHICGFLKLLGDGNEPSNTDIALGMAEKEVALDPVPLKAGRLTAFCSEKQLGHSSIEYMVQDEIVGLYSSEHVTNPQAGDKPFARCMTSRTVTVSPPDSDGNVHYVIKRTFKQI